MTRFQAIEQALWKVTDELRGVIDARITRECMIALFFLKYVSDVIRRRSETGSRRFVVPHEASFYHLLEQRERPGNAIRLESAFSKLEEANAEKFTGMFAKVDFGPASVRDSDVLDKALSRVLQILGSDCDLSLERVGEDASGHAFEFLATVLPPMASLSHAGELFTPAKISSLMAHLVDPQPGDSIYDPACGSGSLLLTSTRFLQQHHNSSDYALFGQEINHASWTLSKISAFLQGEDEHRIACGDTLRAPLHLQEDGTLERFDVVLANPLSRFRIGVGSRRYTIRLIASSEVAHLEVAGTTLLSCT